MRYSELGVDLYATSIVVSERFAAANPDVVKGFIRAIVRGTRDALASPNAAVASVKKRDSLVDEAVEMKRFELVRDLAVLTANVKANGMSHVAPARLERTIGFVAKSMNLADVPKLSDVFRPDYLPPAAERRL
jgi:NitT/TauT family transport system substrate-binding protein